MPNTESITRAFEVASSELPNDDGAISSEERLVAVARGLLDRFDKLAPSAWRKLIETHLEDRRPRMRRLALALLGARGPDPHAPPAGPWLDDLDDQVRAAAAYAAGARVEADALEGLLEARDDDAPATKTSYVRALAAMRDPQAVPLLARWAGRASESGDLRREVCRALIAIGDPAAGPPLDRLLNDGQVPADVAALAAVALAVLGGEDSRSILKDRTRHEQVHSRAAAWLGLMRLDLDAGEKAPAELPGGPEIRGALIRAMLGTRLGQHSSASTPERELQRRALQELPGALPFETSLRTALEHASAKHRPLVNEGLACIERHVQASTDGSYGESSPTTERLLRTANAVLDAVKSQG